MPRSIHPSSVLPDVLVIQPQAANDARGYFVECWRVDKYGALGVTQPFVQDNVSKSARGTLRGLHMQEPFAQGKLVQVLDGEVFDVAVDVRVGSPTFGKWYGHNLSSVNHTQLFIPTGFAHGFCVLSDTAIVSYKCTELYHPETEIGIAWNDPDLGIDWPVDSPTLSPKDRSAPRLAAIASSRLPQYR